MKNIVFVADFSMVFSDHGNGHSMEMNISEGSSAGFRNVKLETLNSEIECQSEVEVSELQGLVDWYIHLEGSEYPDYEFKNLPLKFQFSHFEKGELYYRIILVVDSRKYFFTTWEQGNETATIMAEKLSKEIQGHSRELGGPR